LANGHNYGKETKHGGKNRDKPVEKEITYYNRRGIRNIEKAQRRQ